MESEIPKQYLTLQGRPLIRQTLEKFYTCPGFQGGIVVIHPDHEALFQAAVNDRTSVAFVYGGNTRSQSIYSAINELSNLKYQDTLLIHDAARPLVTHEDIQAVARVARDTGAATLACPTFDTLKYRGGRYPDRKNLWHIQTPQGFHFGLLKDAHKQKVLAAEVTDDTMLVEALGHDVALVPGSKTNIKVTVPEDIETADALMRAQNKTLRETRTGTGFDVHGFDAETTGPVTLCGVDIPHINALKGHSDADVGLHALTDAILGALGRGDIGEHFPPSEEQWKDCSSSYFLEETLKMMARDGARVVNVDITLICEAPKIGPHKTAMRERLEDLLGVARGRVNIKATTTEQLGFTGRGEGIAAQAVATLSCPAQEAPGD